MVIYGRNPVQEAIRGRRRVHRAWATKGAAKEIGGMAVELVAPEEIERRCGSTGHQGVCAEADPYPYVPAEGLLAGPAPFVLALDGIEDPQNLGALCRSAECAGVDGVVIPERRAAEVTPAVCKASAGAVEHLSVARVRNLADFLAEAKDRGCWCYGAAAGAGRGPGGIDFKGGLVLVLGAEGRGLRDRVAAACDELVSLPMRGRIGSLNASAAGAVLLYAALEDRLSA